MLFADVSGFTAMSETLDAKDVTAIMNALWQRLNAAITAYGEGFYELPICGTYD